MLPYELLSFLVKDNVPVFSSSDTSFLPDTGNKGLSEPVSERKVSKVMESAASLRTVAARSLWSESVFLMNRNRSVSCCCCIYLPFRDGRIIPHNHEKNKSN